MRNMRPKANFPCSASAVLLLAGAGLWGCVAGVDVSDEELAAISQPVGNAGTGSGVGGTGGTSSSSLGGSSSSTGGTGSAVGGSSSAQGGSSSGGTGGGNVEPPPIGDCADATAAGPIELTVFYTEQGTDKEIKMTLRIDNLGNGFTTSDLTVRYWFDDDGANVASGNIDYASAPTKPIQFGEAFGASYAEIGFTGTGDIGLGINQVQVRLFDSSYQTTPNETNDFSFSAGAIDTENRNITAYVAGMKVFGCEPGSGN